MNLTNTILNKRDQIPKSTCCMIPSKENSKTDKTNPWCQDNCYLWWKTVSHERNLMDAGNFLFVNLNAGYMDVFSL